MKIYTINNKKEEKFLRRKVPIFDITLLKNKQSRQEINKIVKALKDKMEEADGIGLSANQVGLNYRFFVASFLSKDGQKKFYTIFNPEIIKTSREKESLLEGCLSTPGLIGFVARPKEITLTGFDKNGRKIKIKAWGLLARVFQHETDHLNGIIFLDRAEQILKEQETKTEKI